MKNLDLFLKRILVISLSISAVLLSASLLIYTAKPANAQSPSFPSRMDDGIRYNAVSNNGTGQYLLWNTQTGAYRSISANVVGIAANNYIIVNSTDKFW